MRTKRVTLADVARSAGVSQTAASFVLSGRREEMRISADVEARVLRAARETGYRPNIVSRSLRTGTTQTIGFVSDTVATTPFAGHLIWGALDAAREHGHLLFIGETEGDPELERQLIEAMHDRRVDGIVLASMYTRKVTVPKALPDGPAVLLNALPTRRSRSPPSFPTRSRPGEPRPSAARGGPHRRDLAHRRRAPTNRVPKDSLAAVQRLQGITEALGAAGVTSRRRGCVPRLAARARIQRNAAAAREDASRRRSSASTTASRSAPTRRSPTWASTVPADVSVVSFDDDILASWVRPQLTTVALPHYELGRAAIEVLLDRRQAQHPDGQRRSTGSRCRCASASR